MPNYKAIIQLEDGRSKIVYQEANNSDEASQILGTMYKQDVQVVAVCADLDRQFNKENKARPRDQMPVVMPIDDAKNIVGGIPITTWKEAVQLIVAAAVMLVALVILAFVQGIVGH